MIPKNGTSWSSRSWLIFAVGVAIIPGLALFGPSPRANLLWGIASAIIIVVAALVADKASKRTS